MFFFLFFIEKFHLLDVKISAMQNFFLKEKNRAGGIYFYMWAGIYAYKWLVSVSVQPTLLTYG